MFPISSLSINSPILAIHATPNIDKLAIKNEWEEWAKKSVISASGENCQEALQRLRNCQEQQQPFLDLKGLCLFDIPQNLSEHVVNLDVSDNQLQYIPNNWQKNLTYLNASNNNIAQFPENLSSTMKYLNLSGNLIATAPKELPNFSSEVTINLQDNCLPESEAQELLIRLSHASINNVDISNQKSVTAGGKSSGLDPFLANMFKMMVPDEKKLVQEATRVTEQIRNETVRVTERVEAEIERSGKKVEKELNRFFRRF